MPELSSDFGYFSNYEPLGVQMALVMVRDGWVLRMAEWPHMSK